MRVRVSNCSSSSSWDSFAMMAVLPLIRQVPDVYVGGRTRPAATRSRITRQSASAGAGVPAPPCSTCLREARPRCGRTSTAGPGRVAAALAIDALMPPASLASRTSRDSRSASFLISSADSALPSRTPPLMTRLGFSLAKSRRPFADSTGSPVTKATAVGPANRSSSVLIPASLAAILVSVFFTTAYWAFSPSERRSCLELRHGETPVLGQHSGVRAAELVRQLGYRGSLVGPCHRASASFRVMRTARKGLGTTKRPGAGARGVARPDRTPGALPRSPAQVVRTQRILRPPHPLARAQQRPAVFGFSWNST